MRNLFVLLLSFAIGLGLASQCRAQQTDPDKVLARLLELVQKKDDANVRVQAIMDLAEFGPRAAPAIPDLLDAMQTKNEDLRLNAAIALGKIGKAAVKPVAGLLASDDIDTRFYAVWTIGQIGPDASATVSTIIKLMADKNESVRRKAAFALGRLAGDPEKTIGVLARAFSDDSDEVRQAAGDALAKFGKPAVAPLIELLKSDNPKIVHQASVSLGDIGSDAKDAAPILKELYLSKKPGNVHHLAQMLAKIGKAGIPALEAGFKDSRPEVRQAATQALATLGGDAVGILIDGLGNKNADVRRLAAQTLSSMRIGDKSVVIALAFSLSDEDENVRQMSMQGLAILGPQAKLAAPKLKLALVDMNPQIRSQAFYLLQSFNDTDLKPSLLKALDSKNAKVRINTAALMVSVNFEVNSAMPVLVEALADNDLGLKMQAAFTLAQRRLQNDKVVPIFVAGLQHKTPSVRGQAVLGLRILGNTAGNVAPELAAMLKDPDASVRQNTIQALYQVRGTPETVVPILAGVFKDGNVAAKQSVLQIAHLYGDKSMDLIVTGLKDKEAGVRQTAIFALQNVRGNPDKIVPILTTIYNDGDVGMKRTVLQVSYLYGAKTKDLVTAGLKDKDASVRQQAVVALQNWQGDLTDALPTILTLMKDKEIGVNRHQFIWLLGRTGEAGAPHLGDMLKDPDPNIRVQVCQVLRNLGTKAAKAMPAVKAAISDENASVRINAMILLATIGGEGPDFLVKRFHAEKDANIRASVLPALAQAGQQKLVLPLLGTAMKDPAPQVKQQTVQMIGYFGQGSKEGFEVFTAGLKDSDKQTRINAANHGTFFGQKCWGPLEDALKSTKDAGFRQTVMQHLQNTGYRAKTGIAPLSDCLNDSNATVRNLACNLLANIGPDAADALPRLRELAKSDGNPAVQNAARAAVQRIEVKQK